MDYTKISDRDWKYPKIAPFATGMLDVSANPPHAMHWEEYGNPAGEPVIFIHGGPGGGCSSDYARFFDPKRYRVVLYDQRGCGQSKPHIAQDLQGGLAQNITAELVGDIEKLRDARGIIGRAHIFGGSWGSTLAMAYAQAHPEHVATLILRGIFLCNDEDLKFFYQGNAAQPDRSDIPGAYRAYTSSGKYTIPAELRDERMAQAYADAWQRYVDVIPLAERQDMIAAYHYRFNDASFNKQQKLAAALAWSTWEGVTSFLNQYIPDLGKFTEPDFAVAFAAIENEFFYRAMRAQDKALTGLMSPRNIQTLAGIPTYIVQGAYDQVCVPSSARALERALVVAGAKQLEYVETEAGHSMMERRTNAELARIMDGLPLLQGSGAA